MVDLDKYKKELESELEGKQVSSAGNYSQEYRQFLKEQLDANQSRYAKYCRNSAKILPAHLNHNDEEKISNYLQLLHLNIPPSSVLSFAYLSAIFIILSSVVLFAVFVNFYFLIFGLIAALVSMYILSKAPEFMFKSWRAKASNQLVSAVLYMVIYLEHTSNLEQAVYFAARNLPPPLSLDFIRALWLVESGKYSTISESLEEYVKIWQEWNSGFVESIHLLESSLYVKTEQRRHEILERTINTVLDSTEHSMMKYAHDSQNPVQAVHMLGIILPVMGLVMLPMIISFMGDVISTWQIVFLYNILLPITVYLLAKQTLDKRPSGVSTNDIYTFYDYKNYNASIKIGNTQMHVSPKLAGLAVSMAFLTPSILYFASIYSHPETLVAAQNSLFTLFMSTLIVAGVGFGLASYFYLRVKDLVPQQNALNKIDKEFGNSIFQLGNRLEEGMPVEIAFKKVADTMPQSPIAGLFNKIYLNLVQSNMNLKQAIFNPQTGALARINSSLICGVMNIVIEGAQKGSKIVAFSLITISRYLNSIHSVDERLKDLLAETIASLKSEVKLFIPMIAGIVVAMAVLTTNILVNLSVRLQDLTAVGGSESSLGFGSTLMDIFKLEYLIPSWTFQLIVGIYLIQVTVIVSYLLSGIINGSQRVDQNNEIQKNLFISTGVYILVTLVMSAIFIMLTQGIGSTV